MMEEEEERKANPSASANAQGVVVENIIQFKLSFKSKNKFSLMLSEVLHMMKLSMPSTKSLMCPHLIKL